MIYFTLSIRINKTKGPGPMQKKTRSILEELETLYAERDQRHVIENRAANIIASAIRLLEQIDSSYTAEQAENLQRKLINAIKLRDPAKFTRTVRRTDANT
jgi:hypothetical protein